MGDGTPTPDFAFPALSEDSRDAIVQIRPGGTITWASSSIARILGAPPEQVVGARLSDFLAPDDLDIAVTWASDGEGGVDDPPPSAGTSPPLRFGPRGGSPLWCTLTSSHGLDADGRHAWTGVFIHDVDGFVRASSQSQQGDELLQIVIDAQVDPHVIFRAVRDPDGAIVDFEFAYANQAAADFEGRQLDEIIGRPMHEVASDDAVEDISDCKQVLESGIPMIYNEEPTTGYRDEQGNPRILDIRISKVGPDLISYSYRDVTEQHHDRLELAYTHKLLRAVFDAMVEPHVVFRAIRDESGRPVDFAFEDANQAAADFEGCTIDALVGTTIRNLYKDVGEAANDIADCARVLESGRPTDINDVPSINYSSGEGSPALIEIRIVPVDEDRVSYYWRDVTERRRAQQLEVERDLAEARSASQREFLAHMSHELRTPLNAVIGFQHLLEQTDLSSRQQHLLRRSSEAADLLLANIADVLDFSKMEAGALEIESVPTDVLGVLDEVCSVAQVLTEQRGLELRRVDGADLPGVIATDPTRLRQLLLNLLSNAAKFTDEGHIQIASSGVTLASGQPGLRVEVSDSGVGIAPGRLATIFEPFRQADASTSRRFGGSGLGLAICQRIVVAMGGSIRVASEVGRGSTFTAEVEAVPSRRPVEAVPGREPGRPLLRLDGVRLLVAEDNDFNGELVVDLLEAAGASVDLVKDGQQAVQQVRRDSYDVVILDVQMPVMDGLTASRVMTQTGLTGTTPVVALTANAQPEDRESCLRAGMTDIIVKPVDPQALITALHRVLADISAPTT